MLVHSLTEAFSFSKTTNKQTENQPSQVCSLPKPGLNQDRDSPESRQRDFATSKSGEDPFQKNLFHSG